MNTKMKTHWVADLFPLNEDDIKSIAEDIKANGQLVPIKVLKDGTIIDGRNRWMACERAGVEPIVEVVEDGSDEEMLTLSCSLNGKRRNLKPGQRAAGAAEAIERLYAEEGKAHKGKKSKAAMIHGNFGAGKVATEQCLTLLRNDKERFLSIKDGGAAVDPTYKEFKAIKAERTKIDNELRLIAEFQDVDDKFQAGKIDRAEALVLVRRMKSEADDRAKESRRRIDSFKNLLEGVSACHKFDPAECSTAFQELASDKKFLECFGMGLGALEEMNNC